MWIITSTHKHAGFDAIIWSKNLISSYLSSARQNTLEIIYPMNVHTLLSGTSHWNGITLEDVKELKTSGAKSIVLTRGQMAFLHVPPAVIEDLQKSGFEVIVEKSGTAVDRYNALVERGELVAGLFHTTC